MTERLNRMAHVSEHLANLSKREQWNELKRRSPELADVLTRHAERFGKPQEIRVTYKEAP